MGGNLPGTGVVLPKWGQLHWYTRLVVLPTPLLKAGQFQVNRLCVVLPNSPILYYTLSFARHITYMHLSKRGCLTEIAVMVRPK